MALIAVTVDQREPSLVQRQDYGAPVSTSLLDIGTLWGVCDDGTLLAVWRISAYDLPTLIRRDLFARAGQLRDLTPWSYLVISGQLGPAASGTGSLIDGRESGWPWNSIQGALLEIQSLGVMVAQIQSDAEYGLLVQQLAAVKHEAKRIEPPKDALFYTAGEAVLLSLPGIGENKLDELIRVCQTPAWALVNLCDQVDPVKIAGIGPETRRQARQALGLADGQVLTIEMKGAQYEPAADSTRRAA